MNIENNFAYKVIGIVKNPNKYNNPRIQDYIITEYGVYEEGVFFDVNKIYRCYRKLDFIRTFRNKTYNNELLNCTFTSDKDMKLLEEVPIYKKPNFEWDLKFQKTKAQTLREAIFELATYGIDTTNGVDYLNHQGNIDNYTYGDMASLREAALNTFCKIASIERIYDKEHIYDTTDYLATFVANMNKGIKVTTKQYGFAFNITTADYKREYVLVFFRLRFIANE